MTNEDYETLEQELARGLTHWVKLMPEANDIPTGKILLTWNGKLLSPPVSFKYRHMADQFRDEHKVTHFILIPDARKTI